MRRNRQQTEKRIIDATIELLASEGFLGLGVNAVAARAGADKVLIYRYFDGLDGLLRFIGETEVLFPSAAALLDHDAEGFLRNYRQAHRAHRLGASLHHWERLTENPLTAAYRRQRTLFWDDARRLLRPGNAEAESVLELAAILPLSEDNALNVLLGHASFDPVEPAIAPATLEEPAEAERLADNLL